jgi:preprotein translocase subunit SecD
MGAAKNIKLGLDLAGGVSITYRAKDKNPTAEQMADTIYKLQKRVDNGIKGSVSFDINSLAFAQQKVNELRKSLEEMSPDDKRWQPTIDKLKEKFGNDIISLAKDYREF